MSAQKWMAVAVFGAVLLVVVPLFAQQRDADGTRLQARQVDVGTEHTGQLDPPDERADWRMVQLEERHRLQLELSVEPTDRSATVRLTRATGDEIASDTAGEDSAEITRRVDAGIYYIAVESSETVEYELSID